MDSSWSLSLMCLLLGRAFEIDAAAIMLGENEIRRLELMEGAAITYAPRLTGVNMIPVIDDHRNMFCIQGNKEVEQALGGCENQLYSDSSERVFGRPGYFIVHESRWVRGLLCNPFARGGHRGFVVVAKPKDFVLDVRGWSNDLDFGEHTTFDLTVYTVTPATLNRLL